MLYLYNIRRTIFFIVLQSGCGLETLFYKHILLRPLMLMFILLIFTIYETKVFHFTDCGRAYATVFYANSEALEEKS